MKCPKCRDQVKPGNATCGAPKCRAAVSLETRRRHKAEDDHRKRQAICGKDNPVVAWEREQLAKGG